MFNDRELEVFKNLTDLHSVPKGAYSIRINGKGNIKSTENIIISAKENKPGIDILVKSEVQNEALHIPVIVSEMGLHETVYNTFDIEDGADVTIIAGCGIHNMGDKESSHDGEHIINVGKDATLKYTEKHIAFGKIETKNSLSPNTVVTAEEGSTVYLVMHQIGGVSNAVRNTNVKAYKDSTIIIEERLMTENEQTAESNIKVELLGENATVKIVTRGVAKDKSVQKAVFNVIANEKSKAHIQCDAIIMDNASVTAVPALEANNSEAELIHEAAIGRIENNQVLKLMSLGLNKEKAEEKIINGFLK
jgi:Fe-S cluster assembly scaffold protein SufB